MQGGHVGTPGTRDRAKTELCSTLLADDPTILLQEIAKILNLMTYRCSAFSHILNEVYPLNSNTL